MSATTLTDKTIVTRIEHLCFSCHRRFPKGTTMRYWSGLYEGDFNSVYNCMTCQEIMNMDSENEYPDGYVNDSLNKGETPEQYLQRLKLNNLPQ